MPESKVAAWAKAHTDRVHILCRTDLDFITKMVDPGAIERLRMVASTSFKRCTYTRAIELLEKAVEGGKMFEFRARSSAGTMPSLRDMPGSCRPPGAGRGTSLGCSGCPRWHCNCVEMSGRSTDWRLRLSEPHNSDENLVPNPCHIKEAEDIQSS